MKLHTTVTQGISSPPYYTINDLSRYGYSRSSWYALAKQGKIKLRKLGGRTVVLREDLDRFLKDLPSLHTEAV